LRGTRFERGFHCYDNFGFLFFKQNARYGRHTLQPACHSARMGQKDPVFSQSGSQAQSTSAMQEKETMRKGYFSACNNKGMCPIRPSNVGASYPPQYEASSCLGSCGQSIPTKARTLLIYFRRSKSPR
jgi:hypothetical protein